MKVLVLAPHPFYQQRGTPIAVDLLIRALSERGDSVDVLTFHEGEDRQYEGVRILRIRPWLSASGIRPGLSIKKVYCDIHLFFRFVRLLAGGRYDLVHAVEESAFMAMLVCPLASTPYIYDMDSSMSTQIVNKFGFLRPAHGALRFMESLPMRFAATVMPMCDALALEAGRAGARHIAVLKDISLLQADAHAPAEQIGEMLAPSGTLMMYIGNLESYQGIGLMLESFALVRRSGRPAKLVIIGGVDADIENYKNMAAGLGIADDVHFLGPRPVDALGAYMAQADLLLSPRTEGVNTPMKIYSYLDSGVPVVATDLPTHTQVMNSDVALLASPEKEAFAAAMIRLIDDPAQGRRLAAAARDLIRREYSYESFKRALYGIYERIERQSRP